MASGGVTWRRTRRSRWRDALLVLRYLYLIVVTLFLVVPLYWIFITAFKPAEEVLHAPPIWLPQSPTLGNFYEVLVNLKGWEALTNSLIITAGALAISLVVGCLAAYGVARFHVGGRLLRFWLLSQRMVPPIVIVLPMLFFYKALGWVDTHQGLILLYAVGNLPFVVWMMSSYIAEVPAEIEDSALVDGCSRLGVLRHITLPLAAPGLGATTIFSAIFISSEFLFALVLTRDHATTVPVMISGFYAVQATAFGLAAALALIATVPLLVLGLLVQRHFVRGLTMGALKG